MFTFLATWWFWITVVIVIDLLICEATDSPIIGLFSIIVAGVAYQFLADVDIVEYVLTNPLSTLGLVFAYFIVGLVWCVFRWILFSLDARTKYREIQECFFSEHKLNSIGKIPHSLKVKWEEYLNHNTPYYGAKAYKSFPPKVRYFKRRITTWIGYWPVNMVWFIVGDFIHRVAKAIYNFVSGFLQSITDKLFENEAFVEQDIDK